MTGTGLRIAPELALPLDVAGEAIAILAKRGAGKTNTATVLVEELYAAGVQVVVLDPVGAWWGLRSSADGKGEGLSIARLGGEHGDVPLEQTAGALIADVVVDSGESLVLDLSDFPSKAAHARFVVDFAERLYRRKARARSLLHLVLEEADEFAPQKVRADVARMQAAVEHIVRRGRGRGLGVTLVTQRSAVLSKDVLEQADVLIAMRTTGPNDAKAIGRWVEGPKGDGEGGAEVLDSLSSLETGEAWVWNPERGLLRRVRIRRRRTFDSSSTPRAGERKAEPKNAAAIDLTALGEQIKATAERAEASDPRKLQTRIRELERELTKRPTETKTETVEVEKVVEVPVLDGQVEQLQEVVSRLAGIAGDFHDAGTLLEGVGNGIVGAIEKFSGSPGPRVKGGTLAAAAPRRTRDEREARERGERAGRRDVNRSAPPPRAQPTATAPAELNGDFSPSGPQQRVLDALAWLDAVGFPQPTKIQTGFMAGYRVGKRVGGTFGNILGELRSAGLIGYPTAGRVELTAAGQALAEVPEIEQTPEGLQAAVYARLDGPERRVLEVLIDAYPDALSKQETGALAGYTVGDRVGGTFGNILGRLRSLGLVEYPAAGEVAAEPLLFLEA